MVLLKGNGDFLNWCIWCREVKDVFSLFAMSISNYQ